MTAFNSQKYHLNAIKHLRFRQNEHKANFDIFGFLTLILILPQKDFNLRSKDTFKDFYLLIDYTVPEPIVAFPLPVASIKHSK